jgi:phosphoribosylaminoimidazole-succinocarboxamide synthase
MAEVQTSTNSGELAQRFIEFVMMQAQNAALFLGQIPNPQTGKGEVNLEVAKMFIDQLAMIQEKTRGNLSNEESTVLRNALSNLQLTYVEVARGSAAAAGPSEKKTPERAPPDASVAPEPPTAGPEGESRKKFTKSYGA